ncbi:hypothetical protein EZS27_017976 [termite gut metagenome]|uniref:Uncharacterized protein n=1 Tax=termite gut metagenome TaxID=433724 RepID=A0A5J4RHK1_9ZZZZ
MEATGIYYEALAYHLHKLNQDVVVINQVLCSIVVCQNKK